MVRQAGVATWLLGIAVCVGLTIWSGPDAVGHAVASVGWGIPLVIAAARSEEVAQRRRVLGEQLLDADLAHDH